MMFVPQFSQQPNSQVKPSCKLPSVILSFCCPTFPKKQTNKLTTKQEESAGKMSQVVDSNVFDAVNHLFSFPENIEKLMFHPRSSYHTANENRSNSIPVDILDAPKEYIFYMDVPGLSKSDIQVTVEDENTLVIKGGGKRKREDGDEEGCKYIRLERKAPQKLIRKFRLPENANVSAITAQCENGVLTVFVRKLPPPPKPKTVEVTIS